MKIPRQSYTEEFKREAVKRVEVGNKPAAVARQLGISETALSNWHKAAAQGKLAATAKALTPEQMEVSRLRAEAARLRMENDILKKRRRTSRRDLCEVRLIDATRREFSLTRLCGVLGVSVSGYRAWKRGGRVVKRLTNAQLLALIRAIHREFKTSEGWLLAAVLDLNTRMIVGWAMGSTMTRQLVIDALPMAWFRRRPKPELIHHSDRGSQNCSHDYQQLLNEYGMQPSMSRKSNCWDNAPMESFLNSLKNECTHRRVMPPAGKRNRRRSSTSSRSTTGDADTPRWATRVRPRTTPAWLAQQNLAA